MDLQQARVQVLEAGRELVRAGLIARTWGNVSCRVAEDTFVVTPSGRAYEGLTLEEIVPCRVADASYEGDVKPSSERRVHALVYRMRPEAGFVIHTHQPWASAVSASGKTEIGGVPVAAYGLPGTKKLCAGVEEALQKATGSAVIMAHHGALCFGRTYEEAMDAALALERGCETYVRGMAPGGETDEKSLPLYALERITGKRRMLPAQPQMASSRRTPEGFVLGRDASAVSFRFTDAGLSGEARLHRAVYLARKDIGVILPATESGVYALSFTKGPLPPMLDDFAQLVGASVRTAKSAGPEDAVRALRGRAAVLLPGKGALCCAANEYDAHAVRMVLEKNALTALCGAILGGGKPIAPAECFLMRQVYRSSYAKRAGKKER